MDAWNANPGICSLGNIAFLTWRGLLDNNLNSSTVKIDLNDRQLNSRVKIYKKLLEKNRG